MNDQLSDYDFDLPEAQIALHPAAPRESAKLLHVQASGALSHHHVGDLPQLLRPGDLMVFNDTQVVPGRLDGVRRRGDLEVKVEATLVERLGPSEYLALMKPGRRLKPGDRVVFGDLGAELLAKGEVGDATLRFDLAGEALDQAIDRLGQMPLPPYIAGKRAPDADDRRDYQTIYARERGSAAAPTAGLHFTEDLLSRLQAHGVNSAFVTLHVGLGTFLPVKVENLNDHVMHAEFGVIPESTRQAVRETRAKGGRIVAVGTTALRLLESAADEHGDLSAFCGKTQIFIRPGYRFKCADLLMTNFHLPKSTLFMLVSAFSGLETMRAAYAEAIAHGYRFYSYGDASLLELRPL